MAYMELYNHPHNDRPVDVQVLYNIDRYCTIYNEIDLRLTM